MVTLAPHFIVLHRLAAYFFSGGITLFSQLTARHETEASPVPLPPGNLVEKKDESTERTGALIINADDWGRNRETSDAIYDCMVRKTVSSTSHMVFMEDSERAAAVAQENNFDTGLHLNLTSPFTAANCPSNLAQKQQEISGHLLRSRLAPMMFRPGLMRSYEYVVKAQIDEYARVYGKAPARIDGHHHMHLSNNVMLAGLLPDGTIVRRNFSFQSGEKSLSNRVYRQSMDRVLAKNHKVVDFFYSLPPLEPMERLKKIFSLAQKFVVEVETHPINKDEYAFLAEGGIFKLFGDVVISPRFGK
jgi:predicted glycoside hydrolase/deacetylase ChbG (UPF0249 family)